MIDVFDNGLWLIGYTDFVYPFIAMIIVSCNYRGELHLPASVKKKKKLMASKLLRQFLGFNFLNVIFMLLYECVCVCELVHQMEY